MKRVLIFLALPVFLFSCKEAGVKSQADSTVVAQIEIAPENIQFVEIKVEGMTCSGCENTVEKHVLALEGVMEVEASHHEKTALVKFDKTKVNPVAMMEKIDDIGYEALEYKIKGETE